MEPILLNTIEKKMVWGGESWGVSCREREMCAVLDGAFAGEPFRGVIERDRAGFLGHAAKNLKEFPLLIKIIDAKDALSIQVHPGDAYAADVEGDAYGKTEMWYILEAIEGAFVIAGLKDGVTRETLRNALSGGDAEPLFVRVPVKRGDIINIEAGLVHAIGAGIKLAEIQQNSDRTYRVYDYNRKGLDGAPRELHVEKALDVTDFDGKIPKGLTKGLTINDDCGSVNVAVKNAYFGCEKHVLRRKKTFETNFETFFILTNVGREPFSILCGQKRTDVSPERSVFIPAALGRFSVLPTNCAEFLLSYVPSAPNAHLARYAETAISLGAKNAVFTTPDAIKFDERSLLKCMYGCDDWGFAHTCPSRANNASLAEYKRMLRKYNYVLIIHANDKRVTQKASLAVEEQAFLDGDVFAFSMSDCALCQTCAGHAGKPCVNPKKARPAFHSVGIDVFSTAKRLGLPISTLSDPDNQEQNWFAAVFLDGVR